MTLASIGVITWSCAGHKVRVVRYPHLDGAPGAIALFVRRLVAETVNFAEIVDDLVINAVQVFNLSRSVKKPAALFRQQSHRVARVLVSSRAVKESAIEFALKE